MIWLKEMGDSNMPAVQAEHALSNATKKLLRQKVMEGGSDGGSEGSRCLLS